MNGSAPQARDPDGEADEFERLRLENETLSGVVGVVTSGPDLAHILDRVVDLLTRATSCHACFVYLRTGDKLLMRAASPVYSHLVGKVSFGADQGLAGWSMRHREPAFVREGALEDPRTIYVPELEEERFQSVVSVPIPSRAEESIGAIVLHTVAPREFDRGILNVLTRAASLVAGAIENAKLYEQARERVEALTRLASFGRDMAAVTNRGELFRAAAEGIRELAEADACRILELELGGQARWVAADPPTAEQRPDGPPSVELLEAGSPTSEERIEMVGQALGLDHPPAAAQSLPLTAGGDQLGSILVASRAPWEESIGELLRAAAQQVSLALEKIELIERLTEENIARDMLDALVESEFDVAAERARTASIELDRPHAIVEARPLDGSMVDDWSSRGEATEHMTRRLLPGAICDVGARALRAMIPCTESGVEAGRSVAATLEAVATEHSLVIGVGEARAGLQEHTRSLREAHDAAIIAAATSRGSGVLHYRDTGAYRYLIDLLEQGGPRDHLREAVELVATYDRERRSDLLATLDEFLSSGRSVATSARALTVHVNTMRQRLERIEEISGIRLAEEDLLSLQLAVKLQLARG